MTLHGIGVSEGIGIGRAIRVGKLDLGYSSVVYAGSQAEMERLRVALECFFKRTAELARRVSIQTGPEEAEILTAQMAIAQDPELLGQLWTAIEMGKCAEAAVNTVCAKYAALFDGADDDLVRQRAADIRDVESCLLALLLGREGTDLSHLPPNTVLVARDIPPSTAAGLDREHVSAILTETGGWTSHCAILARAMGLPAVLSIPNVMDCVRNGDRVVVDGGEGLAHLSPGRDLLEEYRVRAGVLRTQAKHLEAYRRRETRDADATPYRLCANISSAAEGAAALQAGAEGIGLFRTEYLYAGRSKPPGEEEQLSAYLEVSRSMAGRQVIVRTLDAGGDKNMPCLGMERGENPFLGRRGIRYCLDHPELFQVQLRALLRAGAEQGNLRVMLPMVSGVGEVRAARVLMAQCSAELGQEGLSHCPELPLGVTVETAAAALTADLLAQECDFFSIGTNDLTQYMLAVDRGDGAVEKLYSVFHPAVLRAIRAAVKAAKQRNIPVGICGEAAADPALIPLLLAWGVDEFSVGVASIPATRAQISTWGRAQFHALEREVMNMPTAAQVKQYLKAVVGRGHPIGGNTAPDFM